MALEQYRMHMAKLGLVDIDPVSNWDLSPEVEEIAEMGSGRLIPESIDVVKYVPKISVQTPALSAALTAMGLGMLQIDANPFVAWLKKRKAYAGNDTTGHKSLTIAKGVAIPRQIQATKGQKATLSFDVFGFKDGVNLPLIVGSTALAAYPATTERGYYLSHAVVEGVTLVGLQSLMVDTGIKESMETEGADPFVSYADIEELQGASIAFTTKEMDLFTSEGMVGKDLTSDAKFYLQASDPDTSTGRLNSYIELTMSSGRLMVTQIEDANGSKAPALVIKAAGDDTNAPIAINLAYTTGA